MNKTILEMKKIEKHFSGVHALKGVDFALRSGEVHALMGENGAGKSTLMKILTGIYKADSGEIICFNKKCDFNSVKDSQALGISIIHQELNQVNDLTVAKNIFLGREKLRFGCFIDDKKMQIESKKLLDYVGVNINPNEKISNLTVGQQQMVEIAKAISFDSKILILDEPTTALTEPETKELFKIMKELKSKGIGMIYISHRMDEIKKVSDRVTVMRDGEYIGTVKTEEVTDEEIVKMMVGRKITTTKKEKSRVKNNSPVVLEVKNLNNGEKLKNISFRLYKGEILGLSGLMGAGRTELARVISGADSFSKGEIFINGKKVSIKNPADAVKKGICYLSEDRKHHGLLLNKSVLENSLLSSLEKYSNYGFVNDKKANKDAKEQNDKLKTKAPSLSVSVNNLSGGNQQKVIIARWLLKDSEIFIFDEPTRGIDIGAKSEMYDLIEQLSEKGKSVIIISSELSEILHVSDRILVMCEGRITKEIPIGEANQENIMKFAMMRGSENL
ncbi:MAG: sugar ABC transporter ATP-binding protein [Clostridia bacterium]|nr:sugar ABC transporter ATP-binding protein [Clostridia bacterium]